MAFALVWKYVDKDGETRALMGHPGAYAESDTAAVEDGRATLQELEGYDLTPLAVVETDSDVADDIYACEEVYLGPEDNDQLFYDVSRMGLWAAHDWWPM